MLCILWDMETEEVEDILQEFVNKSLLFCDRNGKSFHYYLHDLQLDFLTEKNRNQLQVQFWLTYLPLTLFSQSWAFRKCSFVKQNLFLWPASYTSFDAAQNMVSGLQEHIVNFSMKCQVFHTRVPQAILWSHSLYLLPSLCSG